MRAVVTTSDIARTALSTAAASRMDNEFDTQTLLVFLIIGHLLNWTRNLTDFQRLTKLLEFISKFLSAEFSWLRAGVVRFAGR